MELITSDILHPDFQVHVPHGYHLSLIEKYSRNDILRRVSQAKSFLLQQGCRPGQKIILTHNVWPYYLVWFLAGADLGLTFVVSDYPKMTRLFSVKKKLELYGEIDIVIGTSEYDPEWAFFKDTAKSIFNMRSYLSVEVAKDFNPVFATPDTVLIAATSSGSTGTPKIIKHTHRFFYQLLHRNARLYNLHPDDSCLHTKILHHGSVTGVFFLPTLAYCKHHHHLVLKEDLVDHTEWVSYVQRNKISRLFLMDNMLVEIAENMSKQQKAHDTMTIYVLSNIDNNSAIKLTREFGYKIQSIFGCTETSGPLFLPTVDCGNVETFDKFNQGKVLDDFYGVSLNEEQVLQIKMPDGRLISTGDKFKKNKNNEWIHGGRDHLYRIKNKPIYLDLLVECIENFTKSKICDEKFDLVIDQEMDNIYLRTEIKFDLQKLNDFILNEIGDTAYLIGTVVKGKKKDFYSGIKFDPEEVRLRARKQINS